METATRDIADLPTPRGLPGLGNAHQLADPRSLHLTLEAWCRECGPTFRVRIGPKRNLVVVGRAEDITAILKARPDTFRRWTRQQAIFNELLPTSNGVFLAEGDAWKNQRRLVIGALNSNHLKAYFDLIQESGVRLHRRFTEAAAGQRTLDIASELTSFTADVTTGLVFGQNLNTLERGTHPLMHDIERFMTNVTKRMVAPLPYWRYVRGSGDRALARSVTAIEGALAGFMAEGQRRLAARPELLERPENLLDAMLAEQQLEGTFTDEQIIGNILILLIAGQDTTAHTLQWTVWLLATRPDLQERLAEEARGVLGDDPFPTRHETIDRLELADAVLRESIRLRSVAPMLPTEALVDTVIDGTRIPAGTELQLMLRQASDDTAPDRDEFRPDRWIDDGPTPPKTLSFGSGPRFCPGRNLALIEVKSVLAMMMRDFELTLDPAAPPVEQDFQFTMAPAGLRVHLAPRAQAGVPV